MFLSKLLGRKESARTEPNAPVESAERIAPNDFFSPAMGERIARDVGDLSSIKLIDINSV